MRFAVVLFLAGSLFAQSADQLEFFEKKVRPILAANCYACHGQKMQMSGLDFSSAEGLAKVVSPGAIAESTLYKANIGDLRHPPHQETQGQALHHPGTDRGQIASGCGKKRESGLPEKWSALPSSA